MNPANTMNEKITIQDLANTLAEKHGMNKKDAEIFVKGMFELVEEALTTEKYVKVKGLGIFKLTEVESRESINVNTGERIEIQGHNKISFTPDNTLKELINKPFSHFEPVVLNDGVDVEETDKVEDESKLIETTEKIDTPPIQPEEMAFEEPVETNMHVEEETNSDEMAINTPEAIVEEIIVDEVSDVENQNEPSDVIVEEPVDYKITDNEDEIKDQETIIEELVIVEVSENIKSIETEDSNVVLDSSSETTNETIEEETEEKTSKGLVIVTILLILVILAGAYWLFGSSDSEEDNVVIESTEISVETSDTLNGKTAIQSENLETSLVSKDVDIKDDIKTPIPSEEKVASLSDTTDYRIVGTKTTHIIQSGETIIKVALKYYGAKNFWPYIAKHNEKTVKNANNVSKGTKLLIPELAPKN